MTQDQVMGIVRQVLQAVGMLATMLGFTALAGEVQGWTPFILAAVGPVMQLGGLIWNIKANTKSSIIASATNMPEVDSSKLAAAIADPTLKKIAKEGDVA